MMFGMRVLDKPQINWVLNGIWLAIELKAKVKNLKIGIMRNKYVNEDGTPFSKEEFLQKLKTDKEFNNEFGSKGIDQISELIKQLKENPDSRRMVVSAWSVHDLPNMVLPPCHYGFQVYTRELSLDERWKMANLKPNMEEFDWANKYCDHLGAPKRAISLMFNMRSTDVPLGLPFNLASYGLLLEIIAKEVNMVPDELIGNLGDTHIYLNQIDGIKEQLTREPYELPKIVHMKTYDFYKTLSEDLSLITHLDPSDFQVEGYKSHPAIKMPLSN